MLRKWMLSAVAGITLMSPVAFTPAAQARAPEAPKEAYHDRDRDRDHDRDRDRDRDHDRYHHDFEVYYRSCCYDSWCQYGCYDCYQDACNVEYSLRSQGYEVRLGR